MFGLELDHVRKLRLRLFAIELRRHLTWRGLPPAGLRWRALQLGYV